MASETLVSWQALVAAALIGTERQAFTNPGSMGVLDSLIDQVAKQSNEAALLTIAGTLALYHQAGWAPEVQNVSLSAACDRQDLPLCSARAAWFLQQMLQGQYAQLLPEWLATIAQVAQRVPEIYLPELLELGKRQKNLQSLILPVLGKRGQWLALQNPDWGYVVSLPDQDSWETGSLSARLLYLQQLRTQEPDRARSLLEKIWHQEAAADRAKFLATFYAGLGQADQPFLETALTDRSQEVRRIAVDLLASLPESRLGQRIAEYSQRYLSFDSGSRSLTVQLPDRLDDEVIRLGIEAKLPALVKSQLGEKAGWLLQMLGATPLTTWTAAWQLPISEIINLIAFHDWQAALISGLALAARRQKDVAWLEAIFTLWFNRQATSREVALLLLRPEELLQELPGDRRDLLLINLLQSSPEKIRDSIMIWALRYHTQTWSQELAQVVLTSLELVVSQAAALSNSDWELRTALKEFARSMPIEMLPEVRRFHAHLEGQSPWSQSIDEFLALLQFRQEMRQACLLATETTG